jgi:hypothetical protein
MNVDAVGTRRDNALTTLVNIIVAPSAAFESIRERPRWFFAFVVVTVLFAIGTYLSAPASIHVATLQVARDPKVSSLPPDQVKSIINTTAAFVRFGWLASPIIVLVIGLYTALILTVVAAVARGSAGFGRLFALTVNASVISLGLGYVIAGAIIAVRGPDAFSSSLDLSAAIPSLAWLAPGAPPKVLTFLALLNPFTIWTFVLVALGTSSIARVSRSMGYLGSALGLLTGIMISVFATKQ